MPAMPEKPNEEYCPRAAARLLRVASSYEENADRLIYSYGSKTFLSGYALYDADHDGRGNIDCSTYVLLALAGIPYERSPYALGTAEGLQPAPLTELDLSCFQELPRRFVNIAERIGRPYLAGEKGLDLDKAAAMGISRETLLAEIRASGVRRRSEALAGELFERGWCYTSGADVCPGDLVFYTSGRFTGVENAPPAIVHVGIVCADIHYMLNSSGYLHKERAIQENLPAVARAPVCGRRSPAFFARPKYSLDPGNR